MKVKLLNETAKAPTRGSEGAAGWDLSANILIPKMIHPGQSLVIGTGIAVAVGEGNVGLIWARSKLAARFDIQVEAGVIDSDYTGEVKVCLYNGGGKPFKVVPGDRIAQLLVQKVDMSDIEIEEFELPETERGAEGIDSAELRVTDADGTVIEESTVPVGVATDEGLDPNDPEIKNWDFSEEEPPGEAILDDDGNEVGRKSTATPENMDVPPNGSLNGEAPPMSHGDMGDITEQENR